MFNLYEYVTNQIIEKLKTGVIPWQQPWNGEFGRPRNLLSQRGYQGINALLLSYSNFESPYWLTYRQAQEIGANVRRGEHGTPIVFSRRIEESAGQVGGSDAPKKVRQIFQYYKVFNVEQLENLALDSKYLYINRTQQIDAIPAAEKIVTAYANKPTVSHQGSEAAYCATTDTVYMPVKESFTKPTDYYATLFHEFAHSTAHESRLKRNLRNKFGSPNYAKEELIAEVASAFLCADCGIEASTLDKSASYIDSWITRLEIDSRLIVQAAAQAQKAANYISGTNNNQEEVAA